MHIGTRRKYKVNEIIDRGYLEKCVVKLTLV